MKEAKYRDALALALKSKTHFVPLTQANLDLLAAALLAADAGTVEEDGEDDDEACYPLTQADVSALEKIQTVDDECALDAYLTWDDQRTLTIITLADKEDTQDYHVGMRYQSDWQRPNALLRAWRWLTKSNMRVIATDYKTGRITLARSR